MKVLEKLTEMVSTGGTNVPMILGTSLHEIMERIVKILNTNEICNPIYYNSESTIYSDKFYSMLWDSFLQPTIIDYYKDRTEVLWFLECYKKLSDLN